MYYTDFGNTEKYNSFLEQQGHGLKARLCSLLGVSAVLSLKWFKTILSRQHSYLLPSFVNETGMVAQATSTSLQRMVFP